MKIYLEEVFKDSGIPTFTFVESQEYLRTKVALRTKGKGVIIEGPSGIGKTSCVKKIIEELGEENPRFLTPLKPSELEIINQIIESPENAGTVIIDDFHRLDEFTKNAFANLLKVGADESRTDFKLVLIGINQAGESLINLNREINNRITIIRFERNSEDKVRELITKGENVMNVTFKDKEGIVQKSAGSFHVAQMLCQRMCIENDVDEKKDVIFEISTPLEDVVDLLVKEMDLAYGEGIKIFARGNRNRTGGNRPYYRLLTFLSKSPAGTINMNDLKRQHPELKGSIIQITDKKNTIGKSYLTQLIEKHDSIKNMLYYDIVSNTLTIEDPKVLFYLRNKNMDKLAVECGFNLEKKTYIYDFAISFAGEKRDYAEALVKELTDLGLTVFYDNDHTEEILGSDIETYLRPIYESESQYVIVFLDKFYPKKIWTTFESEAFRNRFGENAVIPIIFDDLKFDPTSKYYNKGSFTISSTKDVGSQIKILADILFRKVES